VDVRTRECLVCESDTGLPAAPVTTLLDQVALTRGYMQRIVCDYGSKFRSRAVDAWAYDRGIVVDFIQPGKPIQDALGESFNGCLRPEW
jgi:putative transposase